MPDDPEELEETEETETVEDSAPVYPDGSAQNECWAESGYTRKRKPLGGDDLRVLRGE